MICDVLYVVAVICIYMSDEVFEVEDEESCDQVKGATSDSSRYRRDILS
jgi:hypothetical protein